MDATYRALCRHGYAALTMQDIADECGKSKAALHYHYESKQMLLESFLEFLLKRSEARFENIAGDDPAARLFNLVDEVLTPPSEGEDGPDAEFKTAMLEIKAQAPYEPVFREKLVQFDEHLTERIAVLVADGIEQGVFDVDDPETAAAFIKTFLNGAQMRFVATGTSLDETRVMLESYIRTELLADDADVSQEALA